MLDLNAIEQLRERVLRDSFRYLSPVAQHLIEREIPALIEAIRALQQGRADGAGPPSRDGAAGPSSVSPDREAQASRRTQSGE